MKFKICQMSSFQVHWNVNGQLRLGMMITVVGSASQGHTKENPYRASTCCFEVRMLS